MGLVFSNSNGSLGRFKATTVVLSSDPDVQAFLTATGITNLTIAAAVGGLVSDLKSYSLWSKVYAIYPFVGGTSTTHKFNLKDPRDLDGAYRLIFSGGVTHNADGVTGNAVNGWYNTKFGTTPMTLGVGGGLYIFSGNNTDTGLDMGNFAGAPNNAINMAIRSSSAFGARGLSIGGSNISNLNSEGFFGVNREPNDNTGFYSILNSTEYFTSAAYTSTTAEIYGLRLGPFDGYYTNRNHQTSVITQGLTLTERNNLRTALTTFNVTNLGR